MSTDETRDLTPVVPRKYRAAFFMLVTCFALWGVVNAMAEVLVKAFESIFPELGQMGTVMSVTSHYGAYAVLAIPASIFIKKFSFKSGVLLGLGVFFIGVMGYVPAAAFNSYEICLCSIFVYASGCSILETTCNPFVLAMGPEETAVRRLNFAQQFNPVGCLIGLLVAKFVIFDHIEQATPDTKLIWLVSPYICLAVIVACLWVAFKVKDIPVAAAKGEDAEQHTFWKSLCTLVHLPRYRWGVFTQFFYVGLQTIAWVYVIHYANYIYGCSNANAMYFYIAAMCCFIVFRFICTALMKKYNPANMMSLMAVIGIALSLGAVYLPALPGLICVVAISATLSLMFPTIYGIALRDLGPDSKLGAAGLVMSIMGGAAVPPIFAYCMENNVLSGLSLYLYNGAHDIIDDKTGQVVGTIQEASLRGCYYILVACLVIVLVYGLRFRGTGKQAEEK
ncbi:MAG: L-fucose:H+ symporter permease [Akkermansia sp.]|nr:L-fucose:H+ symporter permease [Akkermansia sp.]